MFSHELSNWHSQSRNPPSLEAFVAAWSVLPSRAVAIPGIEAEASAWNAKVLKISRCHGPSQKSRAAQHIGKRARAVVSGIHEAGMPTAVFVGHVHQRVGALNDAVEVIGMVAGGIGKFAIEMETWHLTVAWRRCTPPRGR